MRNALPFSGGIPTLAVIFTALSATLGATAHARPKLYVSVVGVNEGPKGRCGLKKQAQKTLIEALEKRPEVTLVLGDAKDDDAVARELKRRRLRGYRMQLRLNRCTHELHPPAKGKVYKVLMVEVAVAIDAEKLPSDQMALAGQGSAQVGTEVSRIKEREKQQLMLEALTAATKQAVDRSIARLTKSTRTTKKRRRRGR